MSWRTSPIRILDAKSGERMLSVDGTWGQPGLNLSHWPGNTTPKELRPDLSTGVALNFARLQPKERARLAEGCGGIANNHLDTAGRCALFALGRPGAQPGAEEPLLDTTG